MPHDAFLKAIIANPDDDLPRLVYADFLDEVGDADRAEFIRVQCQQAKTEEHDPHYRELEDREHTLLGANEGKWFANRQGLGEWVWRRGFVDDVTDRELTCEQSDKLFATNPITTWRAQFTSDQDRIRFLRSCLSDDSLAAIHHFDLSGSQTQPASFRRRLTELSSPKIRTFELSDVSFPLPALQAAVERHSGLQLERLDLGLYSPLHRQRSRYLRLADLLNLLSRNPVSQLNLAGRDNETSGLHSLLCASNSAFLKHLDISDNPIGPDAYRAFEQAQPNMRLLSLDVSGTPLAGISLEPLLKARALESLTKLEINGCGSARRNMEVLANSAFWTQATHLRAHSGTIPASTLEPLCRSHGPPALRLLDLADNYLRTEGVQMLCDAPWIDSLTWLALSGNYLDDESCEVLAKSGRFRNLRTLHLANNNRHQVGGDGEEITDVGAMALASSRNLANLRVLTLSGATIGVNAIMGFLMSSHWRLSGLGLARCNLDRECAQHLAWYPGLGRMNWLDLSGNLLLGDTVLRPLAESSYLSPLCELDCGGIDIAPEVVAIFRERLGVRFTY